MVSIKVRYSLRAKIGKTEPDCTIDFELTEVESASDFEEMVLEALDKYFDDGKKHCGCFNESQNFCECDPLVDSYEILDREIIYS